MTTNTKTLDLEKISNYYIIQFEGSNIIFNIRQFITTFKKSRLYDILRRNYKLQPSMNVIIISCDFWDGFDKSRIDIVVTALLNRINKGFFDFLQNNTDTMMSYEEYYNLMKYLYGKDIDVYLYHNKLTMLQICGIRKVVNIYNDNSLIPQHSKDQEENYDSDIDIFEQEDDMFFQHDLNDLVCIEQYT
jgi:hypothetical protein